MVSFYNHFTSHLVLLYHRGIFHDEAVYPDSHTFNPDRFLTDDGEINPSVPDPEHRVFGSGRRLASATAINTLCLLTGI